MTRDEFTDTVASMTPRQREAIAYVLHGMAGMIWPRGMFPDAMPNALKAALENSFPSLGAEILNAVYPNAIPERD